MMQAAEILGVSLVGERECARSGRRFYGMNPATGERLEPVFFAASDEEIDVAATLAQEACASLAALSGAERAALLRAIADGLAAEMVGITERAHLETGLPMARLQGEMGRTTGQLRLFAEVVEEGSWVNARVDEAQPERKPMARPDVRSMLRPLGPVAVFGASNFPLAFSVAGGDTASALAAGNPVIAKAHPAHPGTSAMVGRVVREAVRKSGLPAGVFALLFDDGIEVGVGLARHPAVKAIAFTGSAGGGQALMRIAADRPEPIPCYAEMGSTNPMFVLPGAMRERAASLAQGLQGSFTMGSGQFCTKPGVVFVPERSEAFGEAVKVGVGGMAAHGMLTQSIAAKYTKAVEERRAKGRPELVAGGESAVEAGRAAGAAMVFRTSMREFLGDAALAEEVFGPTMLLVEYGGLEELVEAARGLQGHLTATIHGTEEEIAAAGELIAVLETKVGRILFNGYPTGVEVCHAMVHGGPFPATSDGRSTSVGTQAIYRFARPVCYQDMPDAVLPKALQRGNPLGIMRMVNGTLTR
ncbi:MAG: aldehyde dehydrogenase (NADP(+)) [Acidobacteria bacterium]|nr:aldehyde dehydrogenase (NADP(+)) [Acidobacteriota bacterium]